MSAAVDIIADLCRVSDLLRKDGSPAALVHAVAIGRFIEGDTFERALGLAPGWRAHCRQRSRELALRTIRADRFPHLVGRKWARALLALVAEYERVAWPTDRQVGRPKNARHAALFDLMTAGGPPGCETLRDMKFG
jgi:hypothetical protein